LKIKFPAIILLIAFYLSACGGNPTPDVTTTPTFAPSPTVTPTSLPATVVLVTQNAPDAADLPRIQQALGELAGASSLLFETRESLSSADLGSHLKVIVFLSPPADLAELAAAAPNTQFAVMGVSFQVQAANISTIKSQPEYQAFLAGYTSTILAADWRAAGLLPDISAGGLNLPQAYENGGNYYCGTCSPIYPPYVKFPLVGTLPAGSDANSWIGSANQLIPNTIYVFYVAPQIASADIYNYLVSQNVLILGGASPLPEALPRWAGTIREDIVLPLQELWPQLIAGEGGQTVNANLVITEVNPGFLSEGRLNAINEIIPLLRQGLILPTDIQ
jgi:hypothetical protein